MYSIYYLFAIVYTFDVWGFWWGVLSLFLPIFPMIDFVKWLINKTFFEVLKNGIIKR